MTARSSSSNTGSVDSTTGSVDSIAATVNKALPSRVSVALAQLQKGSLSTNGSHIDSHLVTQIYLSGQIYF